MDLETTLKNYKWNEEHVDFRTPRNNIDDCIHYFKCVFNIVKESCEIQHNDSKYKQIIAFTQYSWITSIFINENLKNYLLVIYAKDTDQTDILIEKDFVNCDIMICDIANYYFPIWEKRKFME